MIKSVFRKIVHLCGGIMPDEIATLMPMKIEESNAPIECLHISFDHKPNTPIEYINERAAYLIGKSILDNHLTRCEIDVDFLTDEIKRRYDFRVVDFHLSA